VKLQCAQEALAEALATVGRVVPGKTTLPVLTNVLLEADPGDGLRLVAPTWISPSLAASARP
jgi:DNA polymerase III sliding clamp (beta) subunit (PCNA family)